MRHPIVVALGGGHGLAVTLQAARRYAGALTAVVSVADDGGSSGRLRQALGIPAPGDARKCLTALAADGSPLAAAFEHRFSAGELAGHALGNLLIAGLAEVMGDFTAALDEAGRLLGTEGRVLPATAVPVTLRAEADGAPVAGQAAVATARRVTRVEVLPANAEPPPAALDAIAAADQVVLGPGSLFTSVLAVVAVPALARAIRTTPAPKIYVCNLRPSPETTGFTVADHVAALAAHGCAPDLVLCDPAAIEVGEVGTNCVLGPLADITGTAHDPVRLAAALADLIG